VTPRRLSTPDVRTARLLLTPCTRGDEEASVALFQDVRASWWMGEGPSTGAGDRALFGRVFTDVYARGLFDAWAVREDGGMAGRAETKPAPASGGHGIVHALAPAAWDGLGTGLAGALAGHGAVPLGLREAHATVAAEHGPSLALLRRIGFRHVRDIREADGSTARLLTRTRERTPRRTPGSPPRQAYAPDCLVPWLAPLP